jgi:hypothetical protein
MWCCDIAGVDAGDANGSYCGPDVEALEVWEETATLPNNPIKSWAASSVDFGAVLPPALGGAEETGVIIPNKSCSAASGIPIGGAEAAD